MIILIEKSIERRSNLSPRPHKYKFYLDENFPVPAGKFLKSKGHHVEFGIDVFKKSGVSDLKHLKMSISKGAILLAFDKDFLVNVIYKRQVEKSPGVVLVEACDSKTETAIKILKKLLKELSENKIRGKICRASINKIKYL